MHRHNLPSCLAFFILIALGVAAAPAMAGPRVLVLWDVQGPQTDALANTLRAAQMDVVLSDTHEAGYTGANPPLTGFDVVVHLNGATWTQEMPITGQQALVRFVEEGGGFIGHEWNAYQLSVGQMKSMRDLILFDRDSGYSGPITITRLPAQERHPVVWEIPPTFAMTGSSNIGHIHRFERYPALVLARDQSGNDAIAVREFALGRIVGFHHGGNWPGTAEKVLDNADARRLFVDAVLWAHGCTSFYRKGERAAVCDRIEASRKR